MSYPPISNAKKISATPRSAMFFIKFVISTIFAPGSSSFQNRCMINDTNTKNTISNSDAISRYLHKINPTPPSISKRPVAITASFGLGTPLDWAYWVIADNFMKWLAPLIRKNPPKRILPVIKTISLKRGSMMY